MGHAAHQHGAELYVPLHLLQPLSFRYVAEGGHAVLFVVDHDAVDLEFKKSHFLVTLCLNEQVEGLLVGAGRVLQQNLNYGLEASLLRSLDLVVLEFAAHFKPPLLSCSVVPLGPVDLLQISLSQPQYLLHGLIPKVQNELLVFGF